MLQVACCKFKVVVAWLPALDGDSRLRPEFESSEFKLYFALEVGHSSAALPRRVVERLQFGRIDARRSLWSAATRRRFGRARSAPREAGMAA